MVDRHTISTMFSSGADPLEELWVTFRPQDKPLLQAARQSGRYQSLKMINS